MKLEKRSSFGWGASGASAARPTMGLVIHYDGSNQGLAGKGHEACRTYWKNTRRFHMSGARGWADIGYSFGACPHGIVLEGRGLGRTQAAQPGGNSTWYSVTLMGGPAEQPTPAQIDAVRQLRAWLMSQGVAGAVRGHRDFIETSCPGDRAYRMVRDGVFRGAPGGEDDVTPEEMFNAVWKRDAVPAPPGGPSGPTWQASSYLTNTYRELNTALSKLDQVLAAVSTLPGTDVDEDAIVSGVLAGLTPERIASAIPAELAKQVVDALASRLTNESPEG